jgi:hypothetical protein
MKPRAPHIIVIVASALTIGLLIVAVSANRAGREAGAKLADAAIRQGRLRADLQRAKQTAVAPAAAAAATSLPAAATKSDAKAEPPLPPRTRPPGLMDFARDNPQLWNEFIRSKRAELGRLYLPVLRRLNLRPEQRERFKDILAAEIGRGADIGAAADAKGLAFNDPAIAALRKESEQQRNRELAGLFGSGFPEFESYERALQVRGYVDGLATQLAAAEPLTPSQADLLERALAESNEAYRNGKSADPSQMDWAGADRRAQEILTPAQFAIWQRGTAHNPLGGSRRNQELQAVYERAVKRMKEADGVASR